MTVMERIATPVTDSELSVIRLLRQYCALRSRDEGGARLAPLVALGQTLRLPPVVSVALASVFQLSEAVLGRKLVAECCCSRRLSHDERAMIRLLSARLPFFPGTDTPDIPDGLTGALAWSVISVRRLYRDVISTPLDPVRAEAGR